MVTPSIAPHPIASVEWLIGRDTEITYLYLRKQNRNKLIEISNKKNKDSFVRKYIEESMTILVLKTIYIYFSLNKMFISCFFVYLHYILKAFNQ